MSYPVDLVFLRYGTQRAPAEFEVVFVCQQQRRHEQQQRRAVHDGAHALVGEGSAGQPTEQSSRHGADEQAAAGSHGNPGGRQPAVLDEVRPQAPHGQVDEVIAQHLQQSAEGFDGGKQPDQIEAASHQREAYLVDEPIEIELEKRDGDQEQDARQHAPESVGHDAQVVSAQEHDAAAYDTQRHAL